MRSLPPLPPAGAMVTPAAEAEAEALTLVDRLIADLVRLLLRQPARCDSVIQRVVPGVLERLG